MKFKVAVKVKLQQVWTTKYQKTEKKCLCTVTDSKKQQERVVKNSCCGL